MSSLITPHGRPRLYRTVLIALVLGGVAVLAPPAMGMTPGPAAGRTLGGFTSQGWPIVLKVSKNSRRIAVVKAGLDLHCASGDDFPLGDGFTQLPVGPTGRVTASATFRAASPITGGTDAVSGRLNRSAGTFTGVWDLHLSFSDNGQSDSCDSGRVTFTAVL